jgi:hypothetical protein
MLMKRAWGPVLAGLSLLAGGGAAFSACVHNDSTIYVHDALAPKYTQMGTICGWTPDPMQAFISSGVLDVAVKSNYEGGFLVGNQMVPEVNSNQLQTETSIVTIQGAVVRVTDHRGVAVGMPFTRLASATIPPSSGGVAGFAPIFVRIVDQTTIAASPEVQQLMGAGTPAVGSVRLVTYVRFLGKTTGGQSVESNEFEFPVDVCNGCLIQFTNNPGYPLPNCVGNPSTSMQSSSAQTPCIPGQDLVVDCSQVCGQIANCAMNTPTVVTDAGAG